MPQKTFKPLCHTSAMINAISTVLNFKTVVYSMRSCPKTQALSLKIVCIIFPYNVPKPMLYLLRLFYHFISVHCLKTQALSLRFFTTIFPYIVLNSKLYLYKFFDIIFLYIIQKPEQSRASQLVDNISTAFITSTTP